MRKLLLFYLLRKGTIVQDGSCRFGDRTDGTQINRGSGKEVLLVEIAFSTENYIKSGTSYMGSTWLIQHILRWIYLYILAVLGYIKIEDIHRVNFYCGNCIIPL